RKTEKLTAEIQELDVEINNRKNGQKDAQAAIIQYKEKQNNVRNNREFESLNKEIEFQELEIQLHDKKMKEAKAQIEFKTQILEEVKAQFENRQKDLEQKKGELDSIIAETEK